VLVTNPPYGERLYIEEIEAFYAELGDVFKKHYQGFDAWVFSGNLDAIKRIGLRASRKFPLFNATIDCRFNKYELYAGTRERS
jgi:putative N6-adenine-specific DNA methylase